MKNINLVVGSLQENAYLYFDEEKKVSVVIDPGAEPERILEELERYDLKLSAILLTHGHYDHIGAVNALREETGASVIACDAEKIVLENREINLSKGYGKEGYELLADIFLSDGETYTFGDTTLKLIKTPGHTVGSCCFYDEKEKILFSGDTLFRNSIGRSDLPESRPYELVPAIVEKLYILDKNTEVFPGHGKSTTIENEIKNNPFTK